jgi:uncharacterized protein YggE
MPEPPIFAGRAMAADAAVPIERGSQSLKVSVQVTWSLR